MTEKKTGHHYIPNNSYLANFANDSGKVWVLDAADKIYPTNPANIFKEQHFYTIKLGKGGGSLFVEDTLANIESDFASIYRTKILPFKPLSIEEKAKSAIFLAALLLRTKKNRESLRGMLEQLHSSMRQWKAMFESNKAARDFSALTMSDDGENINMEEVEYALENVGDFHSTSIMDNLAEVSQIIFEMDWQYLPAPAGEVFITSEDPLRVLRPEAMKKYGPKAIGSLSGIGYADAEITVPLSSSLALYAAHKGVGDGVLEINKKQLDQINYRTIMYANEKVIACRPDILEEIKRKSTESLS